MRECAHVNGFYLSSVTFVQTVAASVREPLCRYGLHQYIYLILCRENTHTYTHAKLKQAGYQNLKPIAAEAMTY